MANFLTVRSPGFGFVHQLGRTSLAWCERGCPEGEVVLVSVGRGLPRDSVFNFRRTDTGVTWMWQSGLSWDVLPKALRPRSRYDWIGSIVLVAHRHPDSVSGSRPPIIPTSFQVLSPEEVALVRCLAMPWNHTKQHAVHRLKAEWWDPYIATRQNPGAHEQDANYPTPTTQALGILGMVMFGCKPVPFWMN